jgi:hypothetical protein
MLVNINSSELTIAKLPAGNQVYVVFNSLLDTSFSSERWSEISSQTTYQGSVLPLQNFLLDLFFCYQHNPKMLETYSTKYLFTKTYSLKLRTAHAFTKRVLSSKSTITLESEKLKILKHIQLIKKIRIRMIRSVFKHKRHKSGSCFFKLPKKKKIGYYCHL